MKDYDLESFSTVRPKQPSNGQHQMPRSEYYRRRKLMKKRIRRRRMLLTAILLLLLALLILIIALICRACSKDSGISLKGVYVYEDNTEYEFDGKQNGCMCIVSDGEEYHFEYTYKTENNRLYIDFSDEAVTDITYEYSVNGDKLTLVGKEGSAGGTYELTKK